MTLQDQCILLYILLLLLQTKHFIYCLPLNPDDSHIEDCEVSDRDEDSGLLRNGISGESFFLWTNRRIPYSIDSTFNSTNLENIQSCISEFNSLFEGCITFQPKSDSDYTYVRILNAGSCTSRIGRAYWPFPVYQDINIGRCAPSIGHIKHELMHTVGFYHEHSRSDRDMYIDIIWDNIPEGRRLQFETNRLTTAYGEEYDYDSIMHYSSRAFSKDYHDPEILTIVPRNGVSPDDIGRKKNYSPKDIIKIKKMYRCAPYENWRTQCTQNGECGLNEYCSLSFTNPLSGGECRTILPDGSVCLRDEECVNKCFAGVCTSCINDTDCPSNNYFCSNKYIPLLPKSCSKYCGSPCLLSSQCSGDCGTCSWGLTCV